MRVVSIHQPNYLPGLTYFAKMAQCDVFVLLDTVEYSKNNWTNRNRIKGPHGAQWLTVPVLTSGRSDQTIREVETKESAQWESKHWRALQTNYGGAPCFADYELQLRPIYERQWPMLVEINEHLIRLIAGWLDITTELIQASELAEIRGESTSLLVSICQAVDADVYLSGPGGRKYLETKQFRNAGIQLRFHAFEHPTYAQLFGDFIPNLSVIDLLFNEGPRAADFIRRSASWIES